MIRTNTFQIQSGIAKNTMYKLKGSDRDLGKARIDASNSDEKNAEAADMRSKEILAR